VAVALKVPGIAKRAARGAVDIVAIALVIVADYAIRFMAIERIVFLVGFLGRHNPSSALCRPAGR
jgi:hypothetical protein